VTAGALALEIRVRGRVQGVGFRPNVCRIARELGLAGDVLNDAEGVLIRASGSQTAMASFLDRLAREPPPLARVETVETTALDSALEGDFRIIDSRGGAARTEVAPDAVICADCTRELVSPFERRFRYPFTTCTHCGPRLSIVNGIPYDRRATTLAPFPLCAACAKEYRDVTDRRFHAEAMACHACGPRARLVRFDGRAFHFEQASMLDDVDAVLGLIQKGEIVAIKGIGGYQIACDATRGDVVARLRDRKRRDAKPFALMARDLDIIRRYCNVSAEEERVLASPEGPIVLLARAGGGEALPEPVAPGYRTLGFMLPTTPLHVLILRRMNRPVVMTSGNLSAAPPVIDDDEAHRELASIADYVLLHDRAVANRVDDSVARVMDGRARVFRRARGYAPAAIRLPSGFEAAPPLLAHGGELKSTFCLLADGRAVLSQHQGDLEDSATYEDYRKNLALYAALFEHEPRALVVDRHPEYVSSKMARARALEDGLPLLEVQHHHAHVASCLAENGWPLDGPPVLGIVLDGIGMGDDGELWGGEFLLSDYRHATRVGTFKPVALIGGDQAAREPWRNLYAHLTAEMGWPAFAASFDELDVYRRLAGKPRAVLDRMLLTGINVPRASSCGRLFDAVAAAVGIAFDRQAYEGQAGALLEASVDEDALREEAEDLAYPFAIPRLPHSRLPYVEPIAMWRALMGDLILSTPSPVIAARFHRGLARVITAMASKLAGVEATPRFDSVALSGGCFQNKVLFEETSRRLRAAGFQVLTHAAVPPNDGGLALGQAAIAAARLIAAKQKKGGA
jgi:hydrogenase maturation protein HypF